MLVVIHTKPWDLAWGQEGTPRLKLLPLTLGEQMPWWKDLFGSHLNMGGGDWYRHLSREKVLFSLYAETHTGEQ